LDISDFLSPENVIVGVQVADKATLLRGLSARAAAALSLEVDTILHGMLTREQLGSTGIGGGIAIPHARIEGVHKPFGVLASLAKSIDYGAVDSRPVNVVFMLLLPKVPAHSDLNALATAARKLKDPAFVAPLRQAPLKPFIFR
jgi:nitrogen PTS system EIIA component